MIHGVDPTLLRIKREGACRGQTALFYPPAERETEREKQARVKAAKALCATCPVLVDCRDWARENGEDWGIWGGEGADTRRRMIRLAGEPRRRRGPIGGHPAACLCGDCVARRREQYRLRRARWRARVRAAAKELV